MKNFCLEQCQGLKASMAYNYPNFLSQGDFIYLQFLWGKANQGPTSVITSCQDTFVNWTCVHGPTYIGTE